MKQPEKAEWRLWSQRDLRGCVTLGGSLISPSLSVWFSLKNGANCAYLRRLLGESNKIIPTELPLPHSCYKVLAIVVSITIIAGEDSQGIGDRDKC